MANKRENPDITKIEKEIKKLEESIKQLKAEYKSAKAITGTGISTSNRARSLELERDAELKAVKEKYDERVTILKNVFDEMYTEKKDALEIGKLRREREAIKIQSEKDIKNISEKAMSYKGKPEFKLASEEIIKHEKDIANTIKKIDAEIQDKESELRSYETECRHQHDSKSRELRQNYEKKVEEIKRTYENKIRIENKSTADNEERLRAIDQKIAEKDKELSRNRAKLKDLIRQAEYSEKARNDEKNNELGKQKTPSFISFIEGKENVDKNPESSNGEVSRGSDKVKNEEIESPKATERQNEIENQSETEDQNELVATSDEAKSKSNVSIIIESNDECERILKSELEKMIEDTELETIIFFNMRESDPNYIDDSARVFSMYHPDKIDSYSPDVMLSGLRKIKTFCENDEVSMKTVVIFSGAEFMYDYQGYDDKEKEEMLEIIKMICSKAMDGDISIKVLSATDNNKISNIIKEKA